MRPVVEGHDPSGDVDEQRVPPCGLPDYGWRVGGRAGIEEMAEARGGDPIETAKEAGLMVSDAVLGRLERLVDLQRAETAPRASRARHPSPDQRPDVPRERVETAASRSVERVEAAASRSIDAASSLAGAAAGRLVPAVLDRVDVNALLDQVDVNRLISRIDVDAVVDRVDVQAVVSRDDVDEIIDGVDVDHLLDRVDVQAVVSRVDVGELAAEALDAVDIGDVITESTASLGTEAIEEFRQQAMGADALVTRIADALLFRRGRPRDDVVGGGDQ